MPGSAPFAAIVSLIPGIFIFDVVAGGPGCSNKAPTIATGTLVDMGRNAVMAFVILLAMTAGLIVPKLILDLRTRLRSDVRRDSGG